MAIIEDEELRNLFKTASEEHIQNLEAGVLHLEKHPEDLRRLEELLREAHSLKGDARMLGVRDVETITHQLEHLLGGIKRREVEISSIVCDRLGQGIDALRKLVSEAVTGEPAGVDTFHLLASLMGANPPATEPETPSHQPLQIAPAPEIPTTAVALIPSPPPPAPQPQELIVTEILDTSAPVASQQTTAESNSYRIDTIRVETRNLDVLMTQAGELTVTKIRIARRLIEIEEIVTLWEEWSRDAFVNRFLLEEEEAKIFAGAKQNGGGTRLYHSRQHNERNAYNRRSIERLEKFGTLVNTLRTEVYEDTARLDILASDLEEGIRTLRLLPLSTIFQLFPRMVRDLARQQGKEVELIIEGGDTKADKRILEEMKDPLMHMLRNCIDHGIETPTERQKMGKPTLATIRLRGYQTATNIIIEVIDNGCGLDPEKIKQAAIQRGLYREEELATMRKDQIYYLIFSPGFSTRTFVTEVSGRGVGLDVVRTNVERLKGTIQVESNLGIGSTFRIQLGTALATTHVLIVEVEGCVYALPVEFVQTTLLVNQEDIFAIEGRDTIVSNGQPISVVRLADLLELPPNLAAAPKGLSDSKSLPCLLLKVGEELLGLFVDALLDEQDVVLKSQSSLLKRVRNVAGATILGTGEVCMILSASDLLKSVQKRTGVRLPVKAPAVVKRKQIILLVEDSIATRTQEKRILEGAGYEVVTAVDGLDGFNKLKTRAFDAVVSDVQMPNLDGLSLAARIRQNKEYNELPIILVTSLASDEDKRRGSEAGANAYITKGAFNQEVLLETLRRLV